MKRAVLLVLAALLLTAGCAGLTGNGETSDERPNETYLSYEGENLTLEAAPNQELSGHINESRDVGEVTIRVTSTSSESPFLRSATASVGNESTFSTSINLSNVKPGTTFDVALRANGTTLVEASGKVVNESG